MSISVPYHLGLSSAGKDRGIPWRGCESITGHTLTQTCKHHGLFHITSRTYRLDSPRAGSGIQVCSSEGVKLQFCLNYNTCNPWNIPVHACNVYSCGSVCAGKFCVTVY